MKIPSIKDNPRVEIHTSPRGSPIGYGGGKDVLHAKNLNQNIPIKTRNRLRKRSLRIGTWNVQGLRTKGPEVIQEMESMNMDIVVLSETKKKGKGVEEMGPFIHIFSGVPKDQRAKRGISVLVNKKHRNAIKDWEEINERLLRVNLNIFGYKITIIAIYAPNDDDLAVEKDLHMDILSQVLESTAKNRELILLGDLNARTGRQMQNDIVGPYGEDMVNDNGQRLIDLCNQHSLRISNGFYQHKEIHKYTWRQNTRQLKSIIDYFIHRQETNFKVQDTRAYRGVICGTDHHLLLSKILLPYRKGKNADNEESCKKIETALYNTESLEHDSVKYLYQKRLKEKLHANRFQTSEKLYEHICQSIHQAAEEALGKKIKKNKNSKFYIWSDEIENLVKEKKEKYLKWLNTKKEEDRQAYRRAKNEIRSKILKTNKNSWEQQCSKINTYVGGKRSSEAWKFIKNIRAPSKLRTKMSLINVNQWTNYYKDLLSENRPEFVNNMPNPQVKIRGEENIISEEEVVNNLATMKNQTSPGPDGIPAEFLKYGGNALNAALASLFTMCINGDAIPEKWKIGYITSIYKKGKRDVCENYRGISVLNIFSRVYSKILKTKIEEEYKTQEVEEQCGFRAGRSGVDNIFCITQLLEKKRATGREIHLLFVDLAKAYDSIPITKLWEVLESVNISITLREAIKELYQDSAAAIKIGNSVSNTFYTNKGLRQGCCLSPALFKIYLNEALKHWRRSCQGMGVPISDDTLYTLHFADDQVVIAQDYDDLEIMTRKLVSEYQKWGLTMNLTKTKYMCIGGISRDLVLNSGETIVSCSQYKYLGVTIDNKGSCEVEIRERVIAGRKAISCLNTILWNKNVTKRTKKLLYTVVNSIVTYGSEVWQITERDKRRLLAVEMDFWRRSAGVSRLDKIRNTRIRQVMEVESHSILDDVKQKQLVWYGHVSRMPDARLPKRAMRWVPEERRKRGRPHRSWREGIDRAMEEMGLEDGDWNDREDWRLRTGRRRQTL